MIKGWSDALINDITAERFTKYMKKYTNLYQYLAGFVQKYTPSSNPVIIDLGVGPGLLSIQLHEKIPKAKIIGIDPSEKMLSIAKKNACFDLFETRRGSSEDIPVDDGSVDIVVIRFSLSYWKHPKKGFVEINRVLKPKGKIVIEALNQDFPMWRLFFIKLHMLINFAGGDVTKYHLDSYKHAYTLKQVQQFLMDAHFLIVEIDGSEKDWKFLIVAEKQIISC